MSSAKDWQRAFARQAQADFETWQRLQEHQDVPRCHKLHFLQMACEKLAKAHLCTEGSDPYKIQLSHAYFAKAFRKIAEYHYARMGKPFRRYGALLRPMEQLAREIEILSPTVKDGGRRLDNCEYPWELSDGHLRVPAEYTFPGLTLLTQLAGRTLLKIVNEAISHLVRT